MPASEPARRNTTGIAAPLQLPLIQTGAERRRLGSKIHYFETLGSTNSYAWQLAERGALDGEIVIAEQQTQGRGRLQRAWISPPFVNLYLSILLRPAMAPSDAPQITLMAAVALAETVDLFVPGKVAIKWPNDILLGGKKVAGILTESSVAAERIHHVVLGIGININFPASMMPPEIRERAISISDCAGAAVSREAFFVRLIRDLDRCYGILEEKGFGALAPAWERRFNLCGQRVRVETGNETITGIATGIDNGGALLVQTDSGRAERILAGDVNAG
jgi:BirA family transcriptional regulator, biotin operon repressor / biotin---[acetyl-CoA-carboxylase] ligase